MANPRKFSEKIALMRAKEAEADAAFHQILTEVSGITKTPDTQIPPYTGLKNLIPHGAHGPPYAPFKTGSLPNINHSLQMQQQQQRQHSPNQQMPSPHGTQPQQMSGNQMPGSGIDLKSAIHDLNSLNGGDLNRRRFMHPQPYNIGGGPGPGMRPQRSRTSDHAPYSPYLTPHPLNGPDFKKFKSDSDIHGSMKQQAPSSSAGGSPGSVVSPMIHRRVIEMGGNPGNQIPLDIRGGGNTGVPGKFPEVAGFPLNGMPPMHLSMGIPGGVPLHQMAMPHPSQQNHHGSLPDLSNLGFNNTSPLQLHTNNSNPGPCSPPNEYRMDRMVSTSMPPPDSPSSMRTNGNRQQSPLIGSPTQIKQMQGVPQQHFQYFPIPPLPAHAIGQPLPPHLANTMSPSIPIQQPQNKQPASLEKQMVNETIRRRISDKMLAQQQAQQYRQNTESAPSPSSPGTPLSPDSVNSQHAGETNINYALSPGSHASLQQQFDQVKMEGPSVTSASMNCNQYTNGNAVDSPFIHDHRPPMKQHSIPNIVLTGVDDSYGQFFEKEFRASIGLQDSFDAAEMFGGDEQYKSDLTPLDLEGLQMLEDPSNVLTDPGSEDQLRLS